MQITKMITTMNLRVCQMNQILITQMMNLMICLIECMELKVIVLNQTHDYVLFVLNKEINKFSRRTH